MKKVFGLIICILPLISCQEKTPQFILKGEDFEPYNGQMMYLDKIDPDLMEYIRIDSARVKKGKFKFSGEEDTLHMYRVWYGENSLPYFPEQGETMLDSILWFTEATPRNKKFMEIWQGDPNNESQSFIKENIRNGLGLYLFDWFNNIPPEELPVLYEQMIETQRHSSTARNLKKIMDENPAVTIGAPFNDFTLNDTKGFPITFSSIAGRGEYTGLLLLMDGNHPDQAEQMIREWLDSYTKRGIRTVVVTHEGAPGRELVEKLQKTYGPRNRRLIYLWENRRASEIKAYERYRVGQLDYAILFDPEGKAVTFGEVKN